MMPGKRRELLVDGLDQFLFVADIAAPRFVVVRLQSDVEFAVEKSSGIGAVVGPS